MHQKTMAFNNMWGIKYLYYPTQPENFKLVRLITCWFVCHVLEVVNYLTDCDHHDKSSEHYVGPKKQFKTLSRLAPNCPVMTRSAPCSPIMVTAFSFAPLQQFHSCMGLGLAVL
jgi:hypothetical protein